MSPSRRPRAARAASFVVAGAAAVAFAAAAEPSIHADRGPVLRVLLHDASQSCGSRAPDAAELASLADGLGAGDRVAVVEFGANARVALAPTAPRDVPRKIARSAIDPHGSSLLRAVATAIGVRSSAPELAAARLEVFVTTDALLTDSDDELAAAATALRAAGCAALRVTRGPAAAARSAVLELRGPGAARAGEPFALEARGVATEQGVQVELVGASGVVESRSVRTTGPFRVVFTRIEDAAGPAEFSARVSRDAETPAPVARVAVTASRTALVLGTSPRALPGIETVWRDAGAVATADAAALFGAYDVVVIDDVPSQSLGAISAPLGEFVERGGGALLLGGARSFGAGGWAGRSIERISPLLSRPLEERGTFLYLALDGSGSMGEPWSGSASLATRDAVARGAAEVLVRFAGEDTALALRRFTWDLVPAGPPLVVERLGEPAATERVLAGIASLASPGGSTALLPPLREALEIAAMRGERRKAALLLTDGRTPESAAELHAALTALDAAGVRVTLVVPGADALDDEARTLREALAGTRATVRGALSPERLAEVFRDVEQEARVDEPIVEGRELRAADGAGIVATDDVPSRAVRIDRVWAAQGARVLVATERGEPVAAVRRVGLGSVAALATSPGDADWLAAGAATSRLVAALAGAASRPSPGRVRVEREGEFRLLVRHESPPGAPQPSFVEFGPAERRVRVPLAPAGGGLLAADIEPSAASAPAWVDLLAADGRSLATVGLDRSAPAESAVREVRDLDAFAALAAAPRAGGRAPLAPWLAAAAALLAIAGVAAARIKSGRALAR